MIGIKLNSMCKELIRTRTVTTTVYMPLSLYAHLVEKARTEGVSFSEIVRRALFRELEAEKDQKNLAKE